MNSYTKTKMYKPEEQHIFKCIEGTWRELGAGDSAPTLAEFLRYNDIIIDDKTQFCRMYKYDEKDYTCIIYRAYNNAKITITFYHYNYE